MPDSSNQIVARIQPMDPDECKISSGWSVSENFTMNNTSTKFEVLWSATCVKRRHKIMMNKQLQRQKIDLLYMEW